MTDFDNHITNIDISIVFSQMWKKSGFSVTHLTFQGDFPGKGGPGGTLGLTGEICGLAGEGLLEFLGGHARHFFEIPVKIVVALIPEFVTDLFYR